MHQDQTVQTEEKSNIIPFPNAHIENDSPGAIYISPEKLTLRILDALYQKGEYRCPAEVLEEVNGMLSEQI